jgi:hypothetical protein
MVAQQTRRRRVATPEGHNDPLDVWREQVDQARRGQEPGWNLAQGPAQESAAAYDDFLEALFFYYGENVRAAEEGIKAG